MSDLLSLTVKKNILAGQIPTKVNLVDPSAVVDSNVNASVNDLTNTSGVNNTDTATLNGKDVDLFGVVSDERLENLNAIVRDVTITLSSSYKNLSRSEIARIKKLIYEMERGSRQPVSPNTPEGPENPDTPSPEQPEIPPSEEPETPGTDNEGYEIPSSIDYTLTRKNTSENTKTVTIPASGNVTVKLTNSLDGQDYYYTISSNSGNTVSAKFEYWDNGRFVIVGDGLKIIATRDQNDDIILIGNNCYLDANSANDIIRIGETSDSGNEVFKQSDSNTIFTGAGDDYVVNYGLNTFVGAGSGTDKLTLLGCTTTSSYGTTIINSSAGVEKVYSSSEYIGTPNNILDGGFQGQYGDCKFLSFLNSLNIGLSEFVEITTSGSNYVVKFKNSGMTQTITSTDLSETMNADGDIDFVLVEIAFRKAIATIDPRYNIDNDTTGDPDHDDYMLGLSSNDFLISQIFFGNEYAACVGLEQSGIPTFFDALLRAYLNGELSNLVLGSQDADSGEPENNALGIYYNHAYAVKGGVVGEYVLLSNPWDGNDTIKLDWEDLYKYFSSINLFGDSYTFADKEWGFSGSASSELGDDDMGYTIEQVETVAAGQENDIKKLQLYC